MFCQQVNLILNYISLPLVFIAPSECHIPATVVRIKHLNKNILSEYYHYIHVAANNKQKTCFCGPLNTKLSCSVVEIKTCLCFCALNQCNSPAPERSIWFTVTATGSTCKTSGIKKNENLSFLISCPIKGVWFSHNFLVLSVMQRHFPAGSGMEGKVRSDVWGKVKTPENVSVTTKRL